MPSRPVKVQRHLRRHPKDEAALMRHSLDRLGELKMCPDCSQTADVHLKHVCYVAVDEHDSQVFPGKGKGHCSVVNVGPRDRRNPVARAVTAFHESLHTRDLAQGGIEAATPENEVKCHYETIEFIKAWQEISKDENEQKWLSEELEDEYASIESIRASEGI